MNQGANSKVPSYVKDLQTLVQRLQTSGKVITGFQRVVQTVERASPKLVILASDAGELAYKEHIMDVCKKRGIAVVQRMSRVLLAQVFRLREREAQAIVVMEWGPRWGDVDRRLFDKWFI